VGFHRRCWAGDPRRQQPPDRGSALASISSRLCGRVTLKSFIFVPSILSVDETMQEILDSVTRIGAKRLVIDSLAGFEMAPAPGFRADFPESLDRMISLTGNGAFYRFALLREYSITAEEIAIGPSLTGYRHLINRHSGAVGRGRANRLVNNRAEEAAGTEHPSPATSPATSIEMSDFFRAMVDDSPHARGIFGRRRSHYSICRCGNRRNTSQRTMRQRLYRELHASGDGVNGCGDRRTARFPLS
jgi:hypothetical protein